MNISIPTNEVESIRDTMANRRRPASADGIAADRLRSIVERIERLDEERKERVSDIKDIYTEAKSAGFNVKVLRMIVSDRKKDPDEVEDQYSLLDVYKAALGM